MKVYNEKGELVTDTSLASEQERGGDTVQYTYDQEVKGVMEKILFLQAQILEHLAGMSDLEIDEDEVEEQIQNIMIDSED